MQRLYMANYVASVSNHDAAKQYLDRQKLHQNLCDACGDMPRAKSHTLYSLSIDKKTELLVLSVQSTELPGDLPGFMKIGVSEVNIPTEICQVRISLVPSYSLNDRKHYRNDEADRKTWVMAQAEKHGFKIEKCVEGPRNEVYFTHNQNRGGTGHISYYDYVCDITIIDRNLFEQALIDGIGNGKTYGLGMIRIGERNARKCVC